MKILIPQKIDPYNTHLKNLKEAYEVKGIEVLTGLEFFVGMEIIPDIIHFHFIEPALKLLRYDTQKFFRILDYYQRNGVKLIYTFHDSKSHSNLNANEYDLAFKRFLDYVSLFIHHGRLSIDLFIQKHPTFSDRKHIICHHGDYLSDMGSFNTTQAISREVFGIPKDKFVILIFGQLQYKNTDFALDVFRQIKRNYPKSVLILAGVNPIFRFNRVNKIYYRINNSILNLFRSDVLKIHKRFSQYETYLLFRSADIIFLPHDSGLTTGIIPLSASLQKPFVYPDIGVFSEQAEHCLCEKYKCNDRNSAIIAFQNLLSRKQFDYDNSLWLQNNNWNRHVEKVISSLDTESLVN